MREMAGYIYHYSRFFVRDTDEYDDLEELFGRAASDLEWNDARPLCVTNAAGVVLYDHEALMIECQRKR